MHLAQLENDEVDYNSKTDCIDPLHDIRIDTPINSLSLRLRRRNPSQPFNINCNNQCEYNNNYGIWGDFEPTYNAQTRNIVQTEVSMQGAAYIPDHMDRYTNGFMNESLIEVLIKNTHIDNGQFDQIKGSHNFSRFRVDPRGNNTTYPSNLLNGIYANLTESGAGCIPYAYTTGVGFQPYDYYITPDFYLRIHKNHEHGKPLALAKYPWESRYIDGPYQIKSKVTDIDDEVVEMTPEIPFDIDNFLPFIREVSVNFQAVGVTAYYNAWNPISGPKIKESSLQLSGRTEGGVQQLNNLGNLLVDIMSSENMQWVKAEIPSLNTGQINGTRLSSSPDGTEKWQFNFGANLPLAFDQCYKIIFTGNDLNNNPLLNFEVPRPQFCNWGITKIVRVPKRTGSSSWDANVATGLDSTHRFRILKCLSCKPGDETEALTDCIQPGQVTVTVADADYGQQNGSVSLSVQGYSPCLSIKWMRPDQTVLTTNPFMNNLAPGDYCYNVTKECCVVSGCVTVRENCPTIAVNPSLILTPPSSCSTPDGAIRILGLSATGGTAPYVYEWRDENGLVHTPNANAILADLLPGVYTVLATDANGCTGSATVSLPAENYPTLTAETQPACPENPIGTLVVQATSADGVTTYDFSFDNGAEFLNTNTVVLEQLPSGPVCATIVSSGGDCELQRCWEIPELPSNGPLAMTANVTKPCPNASNGSIQLTVGGGVPPYSYQWSDSPFATSQTRANLKAGVYKVTVKDWCGAEITGSYTLIPVSGEAIVTPGCKGQGTIKVNVAQGNAPYTYKWSNGKTTATVTGLNSGTHCVTVKDATGCEYKPCMALQNTQYEEPLITKPCDGYSDGSVTLTIHNPKNEPVEVYFAGVKLILPPVTAPKFNVTVPNLSPGHYNLGMQIGNCSYEEELAVVPAATETQFAGHAVPDSGLCYYDIYCKGMLVKKDALTRSWLVDRSAGKSVWLGACSAPGFCDGQQVGYEKYKKKSATAAEYEAILLALLTTGPFPSEYIIGLLESLREHHMEPCDHIRYCEADMRILTRRTGLGTGSVYCDGDGCCVVDCLFGNHEFCIEDVLPPGVVEVQVERCRPRSYNVFQLIQWMPKIQQDFPYFNPPGGPSSPLYQFLAENRNNPAALCATVVFCLETFEVLYTDINGINCPTQTTPDPVPATQPLQVPCDYQEIEDPSHPNNPSVIAVACPATGTPNVSVFGTGYTGLNTRLGRPGTSTVFIDASSPTHFENFGLSWGDGSIQPKGLFRDSAGHGVFLDYMPKMLMQTGQPVPEVEFFNDDWDEDFWVYVERLNAKGIQVNLSHGNIDASKSLYAGSGLTINDLRTKNKTVWLTGIFKGTLKYEDVEIGSASEEAGFLMRLDSSGTLSDLRVITNINAKAGIHLQAAESGWVLQGASKSDWVTFGPQTQGNLHGGGYFEIALTPTGATTFKNQPLTLEGGMTLLKTLPGQGGGSIYLLKGIGTVRLGNQQLAHALQEKLLLVALTADGSMAWKKEVDAAGRINNANLDLVKGSNGSVFWAFAFQDSLLIEGQLYKSAGKNDLLIAKIGANGELFVVKTYGSKEDELLKKCLYDPAGNRFYFGGEYDGVEKMRQLGHKTFFNLQNGRTGAYHAYISYIGDDEFDPQEKSTLTSATDASNSAGLDGFKVYPNPATSELVITLDTKDIQLIQIFNAQGALVWQTPQNRPMENTYRIGGLNNWVNGVYWVRAWDQQGDARVQKVTKQ